MPDIAGYTSMQYIKGQYWRLAADPKPVVFTGNIDTISDDLLIRAMFVTKGQASGTFPGDFANNFLIRTLLYGSNTYLQSAYVVQEGYDCYEYRRIYSNGEWTEWIGIDSKIDAVDGKADDARTAAAACAESIDSISRSLSSVSANVNGINNSLGNLASTVSTINSRLNTVDNRTAHCGETPLRLWDGQLKTSDSEIRLLSCYNRHTQFLIVAKVQDKSDASFVTQTILRPQLKTYNTKFCISDEVYWLSYTIRYSGNDLYVKAFGQNRNGYITEVWGIY